MKSHLKVERRRLLLEMDAILKRYCTNCSRPPSKGRTKETWCRKNCIVAYDLDELGAELIDLTSRDRKRRNVIEWPDEDPETEEGPGAETPRPKAV